MTWALQNLSWQKHQLQARIAFCVERPDGEEVGKDDASWDSAEKSEVGSIHVYIQQCSSNEKVDSKKARMGQFSQKAIKTIVLPYIYIGESSPNGEGVEQLFQGILEQHQTVADNGYCGRLRYEVRAWIARSLLQNIFNLCLEE